jgi:hypothetical protein
VTVTTAEVFVVPAFMAIGPLLVREIPAFEGSEFTVTVKLVLAVIFPVSLTALTITVYAPGVVLVTLLTVIATGTGDVPLTWTF